MGDDSTPRPRRVKLLDEVEIGQIETVGTVDEEVPLTTPSERATLSDDVQISIPQIVRGTAQWAFGFAVVIVFVIGNLATWGMTWWLAHEDLPLLSSLVAGVAAGTVDPVALQNFPRSVTPEFLMTLAGATIVQVGAISVLVAKYLYNGSDT